MSLDPREERRQVIAIARTSGNLKLRHIAHHASVRNYQRIATEIAAALPAGARVLDWGAGKGHLTWLMANRGLDVTGYKVREGASRNIPFPVKIVFSNQPERLPFEDATFDGAVSCGVLEHVPDPGASLDELVRVLKPGGRLFIYFLPNRWSYTEKLNDWRGASDHPVKYTPRSLAALLSDHGFALDRVARSNFLPQTLPGGSVALQRIWDFMGPAWYAIDRVGSRTPGLRVVCGVLEGAAVRRDT
ncbi:MAG: class I SAM-dependent methyltransferase [Deltaproteobacteria bacterium]|nr:class I SAM-dependent methyltransferase [Deltaproteobacteria bacterium]